MVEIRACAIVQKRLLDARAGEEDSRVESPDLSGEIGRAAMRKYLAAAVAVAAVSATITLFVPGALAATQTVCPPGGVSNTTINGGLLVTEGNYCVLAHDTIRGGITILGNGGDIELDNSTVYGGIDVTPGGEIEVNPGSVFFGTPTTSTVFGGITLNHPNDWDIETATIYNGVTFTGALAFPFSQPTFCGNTVVGNVGMNNVTAPATYFGDPAVDDQDEFFDCGGNTITGSLSISNSSNLEVEANTIGGSAFLNASDLQFNANTISGSLLCSNGTTIASGSDQGDPTGNTVRGANTC
jgi:hypothetical protein